MTLALGADLLPPGSWRRMAHGILRGSAVLMALAVGGCDADALFGCEQRVVQQFSSPDGAHQAVVLSVQCGATTPDATWVLMSGAKGDFDVEVDRFAVFEGNAVDVAWREDGLVVRSAGTRSFRADAIAKGISISYEAGVSDDARRRSRR